MIDMAEFVSDYLQIFDAIGEPVPTDRRLLAQEIAEAYVDRNFSEMNVSEAEIDTIVHQTAEQAEYYLS